MTDDAPRILLIRRDNIGDLACTTPLFGALRRRFPQAYLCALVTDYNRAVVDHHPALDRVFAYTKAKHRGPGKSLLSCYLNRLRLMLALRQERFDLCVLAAPGYQKRALGLARWVGARHVMGFVDPDSGYSSLIDRPVPWRFDPEQTESEDVWGLLNDFGISGTPGPLEVHPDPLTLAAARDKIASFQSDGNRLVGIHISARKESQRWPAERFTELMDRLHGSFACRFILLWAPGAEDDPRHPGDDAKASRILATARALPILPTPTDQLGQLIAMISLCDDFVCADGGAMHIAAATGKPIVCLFGHSSVTRWRPWGVPYKLLQAPSRTVSDITAAEVAAAYAVLRSELEQSH